MQPNLYSQLSELSLVDHGEKERVSFMITWWNLFSAFAIAHIYSHCDTRFPFLLILVMWKDAENQNEKEIWLISGEFANRDQRRWQTCTVCLEFEWMCFTDINLWFIYSSIHWLILFYEVCKQTRIFKGSCQGWKASVQAFFEENQVEKPEQWTFVKQR